MKKLITLILVAVLMISFAVVANAAVGTVVKAQKVDEEPNLEEIDESWGEPAIVFNSKSENAFSYQFWQKSNPIHDKSTLEANPALSEVFPEDNDVSLYYLWDKKYLYFGLKTADTEPSGAIQKWRGDGVQMWIQPLEGFKSVTSGIQAIESSKYPDVSAYYDQYESMFDFYWTLDFDDFTTSTGGAATDCDCIIYHDGDYLHCIIAIPLANIGLNPKNNLHGMELGTALLRISSRSASDEGYAGYISWGKYFTEFDIPTVNTIVLIDPAQGDVTPSTEAPATEAPATEAPSTEAPTTEAPATEAPATEAPATEAPATEAPATEAPATEAPATEAPATEAPATEAPATEAPATEAPATEAPATEAPATEAPATEAPATEAPATEAPATEAPATEAPATEAPATEAPATEAPATEAPKVEEPVEKSNTGLIIAIVAVVVVVGAGLGIVLGKKKK